MARQFYFPFRGQTDAPSSEKNDTALEEFLNSLLLPDTPIGSGDHIIGSGPPAAGLGADQDVYFDQANNDIWVKEATGWVQVLDALGEDEVRTLVEGRVNWRNEWSQQLYEKNDMVRDGAYTMIANTQTEDKAGPVSVGPLGWLLEDNPTWSELTYPGRIFTGIRITPPEDRFFQVSAYRVWIPDNSPDAHYQVFSYEIATGIMNITATFDGDIAAVPGWVTVPIDPTFINDTDDIVLVLSAHSVSTYTDTVMPYNYIGKSNQGNDPGDGNVENNNQQTQFRVSNTDDASADQTAVWDTAIPGSLVHVDDGAGGEYLYEISDYVADNVAWRSFTVSLEETLGDGPDEGPVTVTLRVPIATPTEYVEVLNYWQSYPALQGYYSEDEISGGVNTEDAFGFDIEYQEFASSDDWDLVAWAGNASGGGDESNPSTLQQLESWPTGPTELEGDYSYLGTTLTIPPGRGVVMDSYTSPEDIPTIISLDWDTQVLDFGSVTDRQISFVYIDDSSLVQFDVEPPDAALWRKRMYLGRAFHGVVTGEVIAFRPWHAVPNQAANTLYDLIRAIGGAFLFNGADVDPNTDLTFQTTDSQWFSPGESWQQDRDDPNIANNPGSVPDPQEFFYVMRDGAIYQGVSRTDVDPDLYEPNVGTVTNVPSPNKRSTIQRLYASISGVFYMTFGQETYSDLEDALLNLSGDIQRYQPPIYIEDESQIQLIAYFLMESNASNLEDGTDVIIINDERLPIGGGGGNAHTHDATYLKLSGGTMTGDINMDGSDLYGIPDPPPQQTSAVSLSYLTTQLGNYLTKTEADGLYLSLLGGSITGDLTVSGELVAGTQAGINSLYGSRSIELGRGQGSGGYSLIDFRANDGTEPDRQARIYVNEEGMVISTRGILPIKFSQVVLAMSGSASAPGFGFQNGTNYGLYLGSGEVNIAAASSTVARFTPNGIINGGNATAGFFLGRSAGTEGAPPYSFPNNQDMGMFRNSSTTLGFSVSGVRALLVAGGTGGNRVQGNANLGALCLRNIWQTSADPAPSSGDSIQKGDIWMHG